MPTTAKGVRKMRAELGKYMDRDAICTFSPDGQKSHYMPYVLWMRWMLRQNIQMDSWLEDQLTIDAVMFDLQSPTQRYHEFFFPVGLSMHLIERAFTRLDTTDNKRVLDELCNPILLACSICIQLFAALKERDIRSLPIMIPTTNGALLGDIIQVPNDMGGELHLRTFIGGKSGISGPKSELKQDLLLWEKNYNPIYPTALQMSLVCRRTLLGTVPPNEFEQDVMNDLSAFASLYLDILHQNPKALAERQVRTDRAQYEYQKWQRID